MCNLGITAENFNPRILYLSNVTHNNHNNLKYHTHEFAEIKCILSGSCSYKIDGLLYPVEKGDVIICNPGVMHTKEFKADNEVSEFCVAVNNIFISNLPPNFIVEPGSSPILTLNKYKQDFIECCNQLLAEQAKSCLGTDLMLKALTMKLIIFVLKSTFTADDAVSARDLDFESNDKTYIVNTIISYVNENYMKEISLDKISRNMYLSPVYISKIFKDETGESPINYLIKLRLNKAIEYLKEDKLTIKALAKSVGYTDPYYFSKLFKKYYGCSPVSYKQKIKKIS